MSQLYICRCGMSPLSSCIRKCIISLVVYFLQHVDFHVGFGHTQHQIFKCLLKGKGAQKKCNGGFCFTHTYILKNRDFRFSFLVSAENCLSKLLLKKKSFHFFGYIYIHKTTIDVFFVFLCTFPSVLA